MLLTILAILLFTLFADRQKLTVEIRYFDAFGGKLPQRFRITSPDGKVDDLFEAQLSEVAEFYLPTSMRPKSVKGRQE